MRAASGTGTGWSPRRPCGKGMLPLLSPSRAWELGGASAGDSRTVREFNEPPNPLIRFLAREMGLFSPSRLSWGGGNCGKPGFFRGKWRALRLEGSANPGMGEAGCW